VQGWSLNYEMFFYLVFALVLFLPRRAQLLALTGVLGALVAVGQIAGGRDALSQTYAHPLLLEFIVGAWLGEAWLKAWLPGRVAGWAMIVVGVTGFAAGAAAGIDPEPWLGGYPQHLRVLVWGVPAALMVAGAVTLEARGLVPQWRWAKALGDGSYSIYLFHLPIVALSYLLLGGLPNELRIPLVLAASGAMGVISFHLLERPMTRALQRIGPQRQGSRAGVPPPAAEAQGAALEARPVT
jgi:exopolysaccharide production protein ExoZ